MDAKPRESVESVPAECPTEPKKLVKNAIDLEFWEKSEAYYNLIGFIHGISESIQGIKISDEMYISENMQKFIDAFDTLNKFVDETPPVDHPNRFGNHAFRTWFKKMEEYSKAMIGEILENTNCNYINELTIHFIESFGNAMRIDYGTGHELAFVMFLCGLYKVHALSEIDNVACALKLFNIYLIFVRRLQQTYRMEPAGSQGVWSLDDYQFVPFIWGSAQLSYESPFDPSKFLDQDILDRYKDDYMFIGCIDYISKVKTGHFAEHSNQLWSISAVASWPKINAGLVKMYQKEILSKLPIIQHVYFGELMSFTTVQRGTYLPRVRLGYKPSLLSTKPFEIIPDDA